MLVGDIIKLTDSDQVAVSIAIQSYFCPSYSFSYFAELLKPIFVYGPVYSGEFDSVCLRNNGKKIEFCVFIRIR